MNDSTNLCLACGLCCDGTLIGFVRLDHDEMPALKKIMEIEDEGGEGFFLHPCDKYCEGCTIYSERPKQCASFNCGLLKSVEQKELKFDTAIDTIALVKEKKIALENGLSLLKLDLKSESFYFKMVELKNLVKKNKLDSSSSQNHLNLITDLNQFESILSKNFDLSL
ncbi:YkgJ family cysteine cluster protein [Vicingaceae bacterium]|nr:YkgJ family cysteine cluster protein [Vicingaceae bacterium]